jgi:hypothetical protein
MAILQTGTSLIHWNYYKAIEEDLYQVSRFIEFHEDNFEVYSIELARILMAAASEVDVLMKPLTKVLLPSIDCGSIMMYIDVINQRVPSFAHDQLRIDRFGLTLKPYDNWLASEKHDRVPLWWIANNKVKHHRNDHYSNATLRNTLNAVGGLMITNLHYYSQLLGFNEGRPMETPEVYGRLMPISTLFSYNPGSSSLWVS